MQNVELTFAAKGAALTVRSFSVDHRLGAPFEIAVVALSPEEDVAFEDFVGSGATLRIASPSPLVPARVFTGIVSHMEQVEAEPTGLSTYFLRIAAPLWRTTQRRNSRIFQHATAPDIAKQLLAEWEIHPSLEVDASAHPPSEYRVQYGETDFAFLSRTLEDAGITYWFRDPDPNADSNDHAATQSRLVLGDRPERHDPRSRKLAYLNGKELHANRESITDTKVVRDVRPGHVTLRDFDFRSRPDFELIAEAKSAIEKEARLELYDYVPGGFLIEPREAPAKVDERAASSLASRRLVSARTGQRRISFRVNVVDLTPGSVFEIEGHPRAELGKRLLVTRQSLEGTREGDWKITGEAVFVEDGYRPALTTPRPRIAGVQSALVVGPPGEEIHTDEYGRVRVQFHWDREGKRDAGSSCWIRVSQPWAGRGFGMIAVPRVGEEVLVGFFEGDPDQPVVVGRVFNNATPVPTALPAAKTRSTWKTESSPGGGGYNEISLDDAKGRELMLLRAERDLERSVGNDELVRIGATLATSIGGSERRAVEHDQALHVRGDRAVVVDGVAETSAGEAWAVKIGSETGTVFYKDKRIVLTTGQASIVLDGPNIYLDGASTVRVSAGDAAAISGGEVHIDGGPNLYMNAIGAAPARPETLHGEAEAIHASSPERAEKEAALVALLSAPVEDPGGAPDAVATPRHVDDQLGSGRRAIAAGSEAHHAVIAKRPDERPKKPEDRGENLVPRVEAARRQTNARIDGTRGLIEKVKAQANARIRKLEARGVAIKARLKAAEARIGAHAEHMRARLEHAGKDIQRRIVDVRVQSRTIVDSLKQMIAELKKGSKMSFDDLRKRALEVMHASKAIIDDVKATITTVRDTWKATVDEFKQTITEAENTVKQIVGEVESAIHTVEKVVQCIEKGDLKGAIGAIDGYLNSPVGGAKPGHSAPHLPAHPHPPPHPPPHPAPAAPHPAPHPHGPLYASPAVNKLVGENIAAALGKKDAAAGSVFAHASPATLHGLSAKVTSAGHVAEQATHPVQAGLLARVAEPGSVGGVTAHADDPSLIARVVEGAKGAEHTASGASLPAVAGVVAGSVLAGSLVITQAGGFGGEGVATAVTAAKGPIFLQSPTEGQLMIVPTQAAAPVSSDELQRELVDHQMDGVDSSDAFASSLSQRGYVVYERPWDSLDGEFVKKAYL